MWADLSIFQAPNSGRRTFVFWNTARQPSLRESAIKVSQKPPSGSGWGSLTTKDPSSLIRRKLRLAARVGPVTRGRGGKHPRGCRPASCAILAGRTGGSTRISMYGRYERSLYRRRRRSPKRPQSGRSVKARLWSGLSLNVRGYVFIQKWCAIAEPVCYFRRLRPLNRHLLRSFLLSRSYDAQLV